MRDRRHWIILFVCLFVALAHSTSLSVYAQRRHPSELKTPEEIKFSPPTPEVFKTSNGITVYFIESRELPIINMVGYFKGGSLYQPEEKHGLAGLTGTVMRNGGTTKQAGPLIDEELEFLSANISIGVNPEFFFASMDCLSKYFRRVLEIYSDILISPAFSQREIDLTKNQMKQEIAARWTNPRQTATKLFNRFLYGFDHPEVRMPTYKTLDNISRDDILQYHQKYFAPNNMYIAIVGDVSLADAKKFMEQAFVKWQPREITFSEIKKVEDQNKNIIYFVQKDAPQAHLALGHIGVSRDNPDLPKIEVLNYILGQSGLTSRLSMEIRTRRGLTYGISGSVNPGRDKGNFMIASSLKPEGLGEVVIAIKDIIKSLQTELVSDDELDKAKGALLSRPIFQFQNKLGLVVSKIVRIHINGQKPEDLNRRLEMIRKVTKDDIRDMAQKYIRLDQLMMVVVGNKGKFDKPLSDFGKVEGFNLQDVIDADLGKDQPKENRTENIGNLKPPPFMKRMGEPVIASDFDTSVKNSAYQKGKGPSLLFDEGHFNYHTSAGRYKAFVDMAANDGYTIIVNKAKFTPDVLRGHDILVISNALNEKNADPGDWKPPYFPAFTPDEIETVHNWVKGGGSLLLIADHEPFGDAAYPLAAKFGVILSKGRVFDPKGIIVFSRDDKNLLSHPITEGKNDKEKLKKIRTFAGEAMQAPPGSGFLKLSDQAYCVDPATKDQKAVPGQFQGAAFAYGSGRVTVLGEAAMLSAQTRRIETKAGKTIFPMSMGMNAFSDQDNKQLLLNILHYLSQILEPGPEKPLELKDFFE